MKIFLLLFLCASCYAGEKHVSIANNITVTDNSQAQQMTPLVKGAVVKNSTKVGKPETIPEESDKDEVTCCCFIKLRKRLS